MFVLFGPAFSSDNSGDGPKGTTTPKLENYKTYDPRNSMDSKLPDKLSKLYNDPDYSPVYEGDEDDDDFDDLKAAYERKYRKRNRELYLILFHVVEVSKDSNALSRLEKVENQMVLKPGEH